MSRWTLIYKGEEKTFKDWGLSGLERTLCSQNMDTVRFEDSLSTLGGVDRFEPESTVMIKRDGVGWFRGVITKSPALGRAEGEGRTYQVSGPWWYLKNLVYQQKWQQAVSHEERESVLRPVLKGRVVLGQGDGGEAITTGAQLAAILKYAIDAGAPMQLAPIDLDLYFPFDEVRDLTCAEALRRLLKWHPDVVTYFDYTSEVDGEIVPALHLVKRKDLATKTLDAGALESVKLEPRPDLKVPAVVIKYEKTHREEATSWSTTEVDAYPRSALSKPDFKSLVLTVELEGSRSHYVRQKVEVEPLDMESPQWWKNHVPALRDVPIEQIQIEEPQRSGSERYENELISGVLAPWMKVGYRRESVTARLNWESDAEAVSGRVVTVRVVTTDARSKTYTKRLTTVPEEPVPEGLARRLYHALQKTFYEGKFAFVEEELSGQVHLGQKLSLLHGMAEWERMEATLSKIHEKVDTGRTEVTLGISGYEKAVTLIELLRTHRGRKASVHFGSRASGYSVLGSVLEQGTVSKLEHSGVGPGYYKKLLFRDVVAERAGRRHRMELNLADVPESAPEALTVRLREITICEAGEERKMLVLASESYEGPANDE